MLCLIHLKLIKTNAFVLQFFQDIPIALSLKYSLLILSKLFWPQIIVDARNKQKMAGELVNSATSEKLSEMDWTKNIEICELVGHDQRYLHCWTELLASGSMNASIGGRYLHCCSMNAWIFLNTSLGEIYLWLFNECFDFLKYVTGRNVLMVKVNRISNFLVEGDCVVIMSWIFQSMTMGATQARS